MKTLACLPLSLITLQFSIFLYYTSQSLKSNYHLPTLHLLFNQLHVYPLYLFYFFYHKIFALTCIEPYHYCSFNQPTTQLLLYFLLFFTPHHQIIKNGTTFTAVWYIEYCPANLLQSLSLVQDESYFTRSNTKDYGFN